MKVRHTTRKQIEQLVRDNLAEWKKYLPDAAENSDDDEEPYNDLTIGIEDNGSYYGYQTGDNSFTGGAYGSDHWAVVSFSTETTEEDLLDEIWRKIEDMETMTP